MCFQFFKIFAGVCGPVACITLHRCVRLATVVRATGVGGGGGLFVALGASSNTLAVVGMIAMNNVAGGGCTMAHCPEYFGQGGGIEIVNDLCRGAFPWSRSSGTVDILLDSVLVSSNVAGKGADSPSCPPGLAMPRVLLRFVLYTPPVGPPPSCVGQARAEVASLLASPTRPGR